MPAWRGHDGKTRRRFNLLHLIPPGYWFPSPDLIDFPKPFLCISISIG
jgi:hypothetical protein